MSWQPVGWACPYCVPVKLVYSDRTEEKNSAPFPSAVVVFDGRWMSVGDAFDAGQSV